MKPKLIVFILFSCFFKEAQATPSISGISGTFNHLSTITISGSSFGTRSNFGGFSHAISTFMPVVWKDFEDDLLVSDRLTVENNHLQNWVVENVTPKTNSTEYGKRIYFDEGDGLSRISGLQMTQSGVTGNWFFSYWFLLPDLANANLIDGGKTFRIFGNPATSHNIYLGLVDDSSELTVVTECTSNCGNPSPSEHTKVPGYKLGEWQRVDLAITQNPDQLIVFRNMQKYYCIASDTSTFTDCAWPFQQQYVDNPFDANGHTFVYGHMLDDPATGGDGGNAKFDDLFADYSLARVEVCTKSTWNALITGGGTNVNHCEVQIPTAWNTTSINVTFNTGSLATGSTAYVYVITQNSTAQSFDVNSNGFQIVIGTTSSGGGSTSTSVGKGLNGHSRVGGKAVFR